MCWGVRISTAAHREKNSAKNAGGDDEGGAGGDSGSNGLEEKNELFTSFAA